MTDTSPLEQQQLDLASPTAHTFWHWVRFDLVTDVAAEHGCNEIVDFGAGSGMLGDRLETTHPDLRYRFTELSPKLDEMLTERFGSPARVSRDDTIAITTTCAALDVIEHIEDDIGALADWRQQMESGVHLVVTVPAMQWAYSKFDVDLGHHRRYSRRRLRRTLEAAGFEVDSVGYLFPELLPLVIKRRLRQSTNTVDVPTLSGAKNKFGYTLSSATTRLRRVWPVGTSVVAVCHAP